MMANNLKPEVQRHIESLQLHGAVVGAQRQKLTVTFAENTIADCIAKGYNAICYNLFMDGIEEPMMIAFYKDGHVDSGSEQNVFDCMARRDFQ